MRVLLAYLLASVLWVFFSDRLLSLITSNSTWISIFQTYKGLLFIVASTAFLYMMLRREEFGRRRMEQALEVSHNSFQRLFAHNPIPMWVFDLETLAILEVNDAAVKKYGFSRDDFYQLTLTDLHVDEDRSHLGQLFRRAPNTARYTGQWKHLTRDGRALNVQIVTHPMEFAGRKAGLAIIEDITFTKRVESAYQSSEQRRITVENQLRLEEERLEALRKLSQMAGESLDEITRFALWEAVHLTRSGAGYIALLEEGTDGLHLNTWSLDSKTYEVTSTYDRIELNSAHQQLQAVLTNRAPLVLNGNGSNGHASADEAKHSLVRQLHVPIQEDGQVVAVAGVSHKMDPYEENDVRHLSVLMDGLWKIIERNRMQDALQEGQSRLQAAIENFPFDFWMQDQNGRYILQNEASQQRWGTLIGKRMEDVDMDPAIKSIWQETIECALDGEIVREEISYANREDLGVVYSTVAPIRSDDRILGVLGINVDITALKQRESELRAVVAMAEALRSADSLTEIPQVLIEQIMNVPHLDAALYVQSDPIEPVLRIVQAGGRWQNRGGTAVPIPGLDSVTLQVLQTGEAYWSNDLSSLSVTDIPDLFMDLTAGACIPLRDKNITMGALWVGSRGQLKENDFRLLMGMVDIAASAQHRATLTQQTEQHLQRLTILRAIDMAISSSLDVRVTLNILLNQIISQLGIDAANVLLFSSITQQLEYSASLGFHSQALKYTHLRLGEGYAGQVALQRKVHIVSDLHLQDTPLNRILREVNEEFCTYIGLPLIAKGQIKGVLELFLKESQQPSADWLDFLQAVANQAAIAIDNAELFDQLQQSNTELTLAYDATIEGWSRALELRDRETEGHTRRVADMTMRLARHMGIRPEEMVHIRRGVLLHDIGKMAVPDNILLKPGALTDEEWMIMRKHPQYAYDMLSTVPYLRPAIDIPYCHHERWDGKGYPRGLRGEEIPLGARIFSLVDIWDALRSDRPYRCAWPEEKVLEYIQEQAGLRLDPDLVKIFTEKINDLK